MRTDHHHQQNKSPETPLVALQASMIESLCIYHVDVVMGLAHVAVRQNCQFLLD